MLTYRKRLLIFAAPLGILAALTTCSHAAPPVPADHAVRMARGQDLFRRQVGALLKDRCVKCHGGDKTRGGLDLTSREALLKGGDNGPVVVPGQAHASRLYLLAAHQDQPHMPPRGPQLSTAEQSTLAAWIDLGAPYDRPLLAKAVSKKPMAVTEEDRCFWSFQPLRQVAPPAVKNSAWCRTPIDQFILARLEEKGLTPSPPLERRQLLRRASFDLIGLPPTPDETTAFMDDVAPGAYERLLDRLLANPHFGERWARHWLDLARFAESHGFEHDYDRPTAYPYRDFVIRAFNQDLPYNTFVGWQIAGDELAPGNPLALTATGFLAAGVHSTQITQNQVEKERYDELDDMVRTLGTSMLGLTVGCARCHDHKYDPIPTRDYYRLLSTFTRSVRSEQELALAGQKTKALICSEGVSAVRLHTQGADFLPRTYFLKRGDPNQKDGVATPGFLQVLMRTPRGEKQWEVTPPPGWRTSYRRRALAAWLTDERCGAGHLLARVIVNRLWQHHFGRGLVGTPSDFGFQGERPTHPELLDYLSERLIANGWHLKPIHKLIMSSAVYQQGNSANPRAVRLDGTNRLLWRRTPQRLEAEIIRDSLLSVSGQLDSRMYGPGKLDPNQPRRSIYFFVKRSQLIPMMVLFDAPDTLQGMEQRSTTTIAPQALLLMNNVLVRRCAENLARHTGGNGVSVAAMVHSSYARALGRPPRTHELAEAVRFVREQTRTYQQDGLTDAAIRAQVDFCQVLLELNEFIYVD